MKRMANQVTNILADTQQDAKQASDFSNVVTQEIQAANTYLSDQDAKSDGEFRRLGWEAHRLHRNFSARRDLLAEQITRQVAIDTTLATSRRLLFMKSPRAESASQSTRK